MSRRAVLKPLLVVRGISVWTRLFLLLAAMILALPTPALADNAHPDAPTCGGSATKIRRVPLTLKTFEDQDRPRYACVVSLVSVAEAISLSEGVAEEGDAKDKERVYRMGSERWRTAISRKAGDIKDRWPKLEVKQSRDCGSHASATDICQPQFKLSKRNEQGEPLEHFMQCAENDNPSTGDPRVVVILVEAHMTEKSVTHQPAICGLTLDRTTVSFNVEDVTASGGKGGRVVASVLGGDYAETPGVLISKDRTELPLYRRCRLHDIALPASSATGDANVRLFLGREGTEGGQSTPSPDAECNVPVVREGHFKMTLPYVRIAERRRIVVELGNRQRYTYARYEGSWFDFEPPATMQMRQAAISFQWKRHCLYPLTSSSRRESLVCPEVSLPDAGVSCRGSPVMGGTDACGYVCDPQPADMEAARAASAGGRGPDAARAKPRRAPRSSGRPSSEEQVVREPDVVFDLPVHARFRRPGNVEDQWVEQIVYNGQPLSGYVPMDERYVDVDFSAWLTEGSFAKLRDRPAAKIWRIKVRGPNGDLHYIALPAGDDGPPKARVSMPGARCDAAVTYQIEGERPHREVSLSLQGGRLVLLHPEATEEVLWPSLSLGLSLVMLNITPDLRSLDVPIEPLATIGASLSYRVRGWPLVFEARYSFSFGAQGYFRVQTPAESRAEVRPVPYTRHLLEVAPMWAPAKDVRFGGSVGFLAGIPLLDADRGRVGQINGAFTTGLILQYFPVKNWSVEAVGRLFWGEPVYRFESNFLDAPTWSEVADFRGALELRLRYTYE